MRRLLIILISALSLSVNAQFMFPGVAASAGAGGGGAFEELTDGNTVTRCIAAPAYLTMTGDSVTTWADSTANNNDLLQAALNIAPRYFDNCVNFAGGSGDANDYISATIVGLDQPTTIYIVLNQKTWTSSDRIFDGLTSNSGTLFQYSTTPNITLRAPTLMTEMTELPVNTWGIVTMVINSTSSSIRVNSGTAITGDAGTNNMGGIVLGAAYNGGSASNIAVKELIIRDVADNGTTQLAIIADLNAKYSIY